VSEQADEPEHKLKIAERIRKLLALGQSSNMHEAANAAAAAQRLMEEHKLSQADLDEVDPGKLTSVPLGGDGMMAPWKFVLATAVARSFFCEAVGLRVGQRRKVRIVGRQEDTEATVEVFRYLVKETDRMADEEVKDPFVVTSGRNTPGGIDVRAYKDSFRRGAVQAITERLRRGREEFARASDRAMAIAKNNRDEIKEFMKAKFGESKETQGGLGKQDLDEVALYRGYVRGSEMHIPGKAEPAEKGRLIEDGKTKTTRRSKDFGPFRSTDYDFDEDMLDDLIEDLEDLLSKPTRRKPGSGQSPYGSDRRPFYEEGGGGGDGVKLSPSVVLDGSKTGTNVPESKLSYVFWTGTDDPRDANDVVCLLGMAVARGNDIYAKLRALDSGCPCKKIHEWKRDKNHTGPDEISRLASICKETFHI